MDKEEERRNDGRGVERTLKRSAVSFPPSL